MERRLPLAARREADLRALFTHRMPLDRDPEGYRMFDAKTDGCIKVTLDPAQAP